MSNIIFDINGIKTTTINNEIWYVARDIGKKIGLSNMTVALKKVPLGWKRDTLLGYIVNISGLYYLVLSSNKPEAQKIKETICNKILATIPKEEIIYKQKLEQAEKRIKEKEEEIRHLNTLLRYKTKRKFKKGESVYIIENPCIKDIFKIGISDDINKRIHQYDSCSSINYKVLYHKLVPKNTKKIIEDILLFIFDNQREQTTGRKREWIKIEYDIIQKEIDDIYNYIVSHRQKYDKTYIFDDCFEKESEKKEPEVLSKVCISCHTLKLLDEYYKRDENIDSLETRCKECYAKYQKKAKLKREAPITTELIEKVCRKCKKTQQISFFKKHPTSKDGYSYVCKECLPEFKTKRKEYEEKIEKRCAKCSKIKPINEYNNCCSSGDGKTNYCKECGKVVSKENRERRKKQKIKDIEEKECTNCKENKPILSFWKNSSTGDGYNYICKTCYYILRMERRHAKDQTKVQKSPEIIIEDDVIEDDVIEDDVIEDDVIEGKEK